MFYEGGTSCPRRCRLLGSKVPPSRVEGAASLHLTSTSEDFYMRTPVRTYLLKNHENVWRIHQKALSLHVMRQKTFQTRYISYVLLALTCLLTACSGGGSSSEELDPPAPTPTPSPTPENQEIKLNVSVWQTMEGMRATTFDNGTITEGNFKVAAYNADTATPYFDFTQVNYVTDHWEMVTRRNWPASGSLDFFAYMPASYPSYVNTFHYDTPRTPRIVCANMPVTITAGSDDTQELVVALKTDQNRAGQGASGVTLNFMRPFARVYFKLSAASGSAVKINSITIPGIYRNASCTFNGTSSVWSGWGYAENFVLSAPSSSEAATGDTPYLVIPNNYGTKTFTVNATWTDWSNVTKDVSADVTVNWQAGYSYTYTFTLSKYALKVDTSKYTEQW